MIIGHEKICNFLEKAIRNNRIAHAYLFSGPEHVGKRSVSEWFASKLVNVPEEKLLSLPDFYVLSRNVDEDGDLEKNIGIDAVRELRRRLGLSSFLDSWKVALIPEAETLRAEAANALLKTLEEPKAKVCLILLAKHISSVPKTIVSRCQILKFLQVPNKNIYHKLLELGANHEEALELSRVAHGLPGLAINLFKNEEAKTKFNKEFNELKNLMSSSVAERLVVAKKIVEDNVMDDLFDSWLTLLRNQMLLYYNCNELAAENKTLQTGYSPHKTLEATLRAKELLAMNVNKNLILDNILINL